MYIQERKIMISISMIGLGELGLSEENQEEISCWAYRKKSEDHFPLERIQREFPEMNIATPLEAPHEVWVDCSQNVIISEEEGTGPSPGQVAIWENEDRLADLLGANPGDFTLIGRVEFPKD
jgi:hypothetical protein